MSNDTWKPLGEFPAYSEDGEEFFLVARGRYVDDTLVERSLSTLGGQEVTQLDKGVYEIVDSGLIIKSDDPDAT